MLLLLFIHECKCTYAHTPETAATKENTQQIFWSYYPENAHNIAYSVYGTAMNVDTKERTKRTVNEGERKTIAQKKCSKKIMRVTFWCKCRWWWKKPSNFNDCCVCECVNFKWNTCIDCQSHKPNHTIWNGKRFEATKRINYTNVRMRLCTIKIVRISSIAISISIQFVNCDLQSDARLVWFSSYFFYLQTERFRHVQMHTCACVWVWVIAAVCPAKDVLLF